MTQKLTFLDKLTLYFHKDIDTLRENFAEREINRILRMRDLYKEILRNPMEPDHQRKRWLMEKYHIQERQALYDIADLRAVVGPSLKFDKEFERYEMAQGLRDMMVIAKEKNDVKSYASLAKEYNSIMRLSKDDPEKVKKDMIPMSIEPTDDLTILGLKPLKEDEAEMKKRIRDRFNKKAISDANFEDIGVVPIDPFRKPVEEEK